MKLYRIRIDFTYVYNQIDSQEKKKENYSFILTIQVQFSEAFHELPSLPTEVLLRKPNYFQSSSSKPNIATSIGSQTNL